MQIITPEDLIEYLYNEGTAQKREEVRAALENNWSLKEVFEQLTATKKQLDEIDLSPRDEVIQRILDHGNKIVSHPHLH